MAKFKVLLVFSIEACMLLSHSISVESSFCALSFSSSFLTIKIKAKKPAVIKKSRIIKSVCIWLILFNAGFILTLKKIKLNHEEKTRTQEIFSGFFTFFIINFVYQYFLPRQLDIFFFLLSVSFFIFMETVQSFFASSGKRAFCNDWHRLFITETAGIR